VDRPLIAALILSAMLATSASAYEVGPGTTDNILRLQLDDRIGLTGRVTFSATVADAPDWIVCGEPLVVEGRVVEIVVPFDVLEVPAGARGVLSLRIVGGAAGAASEFDRIHPIDLTVVPIAERVQRDFDVDECCLTPASAESPSASPELPRLLRSHPNPANGLVNIVFALPLGGTARLRIFDVQGRRMRELATPRLDPGYHRIAWDTKDEDGRELSPGVYFYDLEVGDWSETRKLEILR